MTTSASGNPLGPYVQPPANDLPIPTSITGRHVTLVPRDPSQFADLFECLGGQENAFIWDYVPNGPLLDRASFDADFTSRKYAPPDMVRYTILDNASRKAVGSISLMAIAPANRTVEVGYVLFSPKLQRTRAATEVMYLLACTVFETMSYRRWEWKCDNLNAPSKRAALRFGFEFEGVFRQHMIIKGRNRDTAWFALLDCDWLVVKAGYEKWLDDGNFDGEGKQRQSLVALRDASRATDA